MAFINDQDRERIADAIREVENLTSGELVTVIAETSDDYSYIPTLWAAVAGLMIPVGLFLLGAITRPDHLVLAELGLFIALGVVFHWGPLKMKLLPAGVKRDRARRLAREAFFTQGLHLTADRTGIMIFVSVGERYVEILADQGIDEKVDPLVWQKAVDDFTSEVKAGRVAEGFLKAIEDCGKILIEHFPKTPGNKNELPNHLIEI